MFAQLTSHLLFYLRANKKEFEKITQYRDKFEKPKRRKRRAAASDNELVQFPLQKTVDIGLNEKETSNNEQINENEKRHRLRASGIDRGFFISGNEYRDEYSAAKLSDIPKDELDVSRVIIVNIKLCLDNATNGENATRSSSARSSYRTVGCNRRSRTRTRSRSIEAEIE